MYQTLFCSFLKNTETLFNSKQWQSKPLYLYERNESDLYYPLTIYKDDRSSRLNVLQNFLLKPATLLKLALLHGCFSIFLNSTNGTKSDKASHVFVHVSFSFNHLMHFLPKWSDTIQKSFLNVSDHSGTLLIEGLKMTFMLPLTYPKLPPGHRPWIAHT